VTQQQAAWTSRHPSRPTCEGGIQPPATPVERSSAAWSGWSRGSLGAWAWSGPCRPRPAQRRRRPQRWSGRSRSSRPGSPRGAAAAGCA